LRSVEEGRTKASSCSAAIMQLSKCKNFQSTINDQQSTIAHQSGFFKKVIQVPKVTASF